MKTDQRKIDGLFQFLFFGLAILYVIVYMPFGFEDTDTGYIFGSSWNIYNGQLPHRDFIYTRPAIPAYFHTIFLYISETYGYILDRSFFYVQVFFYSFLGAKLLSEKFKITSKATLYFLATLGAIVSIHNYPPMGWNTIDGIFFSIIGLYFILKEKTTVLQILLGAMILMLGVFSKQSFYFMPIFLCIYLLLKKDWFRLKLYVGFGIISLLTYIIFKLANGTFLPFLEQTFTRTGSGDLIDVGIKTYYLALKFNVLYFLGTIILLVLSKKFLRNWITYLLANIILATFILLSFLKWNNDWHVINYVFQLLFITVVAISLYRYIFHKKNEYLLLMLLLTLSWCASISQGYQTPIHFSLPLVFGMYVIIFSEKEYKKFPIIPAAFSLVLILIIFWFGYQNLYRDSNRNQLSYKMEAVFPQLKFIKSDKRTFDKYSELKDLSEKYSKFTVLPSMTLAHYLTKTVNPIGTDWALDVEINDEAEKLLKQLERKKTFVFLEKNTESPEGFEGYKIMDLIKKNWIVINETNDFVVYKPRTID